MQLQSISNVLTPILLAVIGFLIVLFRSSIESWVKTSVEGAAQESLARVNWSSELGRELEKTRGVERQELRYQSYGALWTKLRPLAIYDEPQIDKAAAKALAKDLSNWYFSDTGGLLLTPQARDFYFALQDVLRLTTDVSDEWSAERTHESEGHQRRAVRELSGNDSATARVLDYFEALDFREWDTRAPALGRSWRDGMRSIARKWSSLDAEQRFAVLQQAGSVLRSSLANDLESRLR
jgi:hypothetical protein